MARLIAALFKARRCSSTLARLKDFFSLLGWLGSPSKMLTPTSTACFSPLHRILPRGHAGANRARCNGKRRETRERERDWCTATTVCQTRITFCTSFALTEESPLSPTTSITNQPAALGSLPNEQAASGAPCLRRRLLLLLLAHWSRRVVVVVVAHRGADRRQSSH